MLFLFLKYLQKARGQKGSTVDRREMSGTDVYSERVASRQVRKPHQLDARRCCNVESTSLTLIQRRNSIVCPVGKQATPYESMYFTLNRRWYGVVT